MDDKIAGEASKLATQAQDLATQLKAVAQQITDAAAATPVGIPDGHMPFVALLTIFALACFVGYYVVWRVTPALHSPLMAVTNAVSSVIIVGALLAAGLQGMGAAQIFGFIAVALAAVNIFGGFIVTHRMLSMFKKKQPVKK
ncbi:NAD(P) transhydrogenase subunit alpha [Reyranella sp.]|uniref:NAD(P) transhydrogenase subunit alpha n=1 Tax=Reyranella sp. TaxID=1929291 RepID=UPI0011F4BF77|nr:NAD(P) transhydrogenase subunit alpha [Reyranella sp.]TAJ84647.1 MAG: NAD(P) transhydrogenase subunit alpha [Reyranella sp.]